MLHLAASSMKGRGDIELILQLHPSKVNCQHCLLLGSAGLTKHSCMTVACTLMALYKQHFLLSAWIETLSQHSQAGSTQMVLQQHYAPALSCFSRTLQAWS